jgi:hypothetical protein
MMSRIADKAHQSVSTTPVGPSRFFSAAQPKPHPTMSFQYDMGYVNSRPIDVGLVLQNNSLMNQAMAAKGLAQWSAGQLMGSGQYLMPPAEIIQAQCMSVAAGTPCGGGQVVRADGHGGRLCCNSPAPIGARLGMMM